MIRRMLRGLVAALAVVAAVSASAEKIPATIGLLTPEGTEISAAKALTNNGKPMLVSLWATWCGPCVNELSAIAPKVKDWEKELGVKVVAVNVEGLSDKTKSRTEALIKSRSLDGIEFLFEKDRALSQMFKVTGIPFMIYLDGNGEVLGVTTGFDPELGADHILNHLKELIANSQK